MKQQVSPAIVAVAIIIVVAIAGFIGFKVLRSGGKVDTDSMAQHYGMKEVPHTAMGMKPQAPGMRGMSGGMPANMSGGMSGGQ